mmetsp:Transcript_28628/g.48339  ORF Transcript_28628/g.48339 Transcript_28628/m.48339 type:complete len:82 (-) Transcript_28628:27-272(-)
MQFEGAVVVNAVGVVNLSAATYLSDVSTTISRVVEGRTVGVNLELSGVSFAAEVSTNITEGYTFFGIDIDSLFEGVLEESS